MRHGHFVLRGPAKPGFVGPFIPAVHTVDRALHERQSPLPRVFAFTPRGHRFAQHIDTAGGQDGVDDRLGVIGGVVKGHKG